MAPFAPLSVTSLRDQVLAHAASRSSVRVTAVPCGTTTSRSLVSTARCVPTAPPMTPPMMAPVAAAADDPADDGAGRCARRRPWRRRRVGAPALQLGLHPGDRSPRSGAASAVDRRSTPASSVSVPVVSLLFSDSLIAVTLRVTFEPAGITTRPAASFTSARDGGGHLVTHLVACCERISASVVGGDRACRPRARRRGAGRRWGAGAGGAAGAGAGAEPAAGSAWASASAWAPPAWAAARRRSGGGRRRRGRIGRAG